MTTRLYPSTSSSSFSISAWLSSWNTVAAGALTLASSPVVSQYGAFNPIVFTDGDGTSGHYVAGGRLVSPPLWGDQIIGGTIKGQVVGYESDAANNMTAAIGIQVVKPDGTIRGTLLAVTAPDDLTYEFGTNSAAANNRRLRDANENTTISLTEVACSAGDRIVIELGHFQQSTAGLGDSLRLGGPALVANTQLAENDSDTYDIFSTHPSSWIEFSQDIEFELAPGYGASFQVPINADATGVADAATSTVVPPLGMREGDLIYLTCQIQNAASGNMTISNAGGQTWNGTATEATGNDQSLKGFWARFNGTWSANPSVASAALSGTQPFSVQAHVVRPPNSGFRWVENVAFAGATYAAPSSPFTVTITGQTTTLPDAVTFATFCAADDVEWNSNSQGSLMAYRQNIELRNLAGGDQSISTLLKLMPAVGATGNFSFNQFTNGPDAGVTGIVSFAAIPPRKQAPVVVRQAIQRSAVW